MRMREPSRAWRLAAMRLSQRDPFVTLPPTEYLVPDGYVTDGKRLLRVVSHFEADAGSMFASSRTA
jgi:hypothetical protein